MTEPVELTQGTSWTWLISLSEYQAPTWTLTYILLGPNEFKQTIQAADENGDHRVTVLPAASGDYPPGEYRWASYVSDGTDRHQIDCGFIEVLADFANNSVTSTTQQTHNEWVLDTYRS